MPSRPVVLVHGLGASRGSFKKLAPALTAAGFTPFTLEWGRHGHGLLTHPRIGRHDLGGFGDAVRSAQELAAYVDEVLAETGAAHVDLVAHSYGALVAQYYLKRLGGAAKVRRIVGLAPTWNGTSANGLLSHWVGRRLGGLLMGASIKHQARGSAFIDELYADGGPAEGVGYTTISPRLDVITTPASGQRLEGRGTNHIRLHSRSGHIGILTDDVAIRHVVLTLARD